MSTDRTIVPDHAIGHAPYRRNVNVRTLFVVLLAAALALSLTPTATAGPPGQGAAAGPPGQETADVLAFADLEVVSEDTARLVRGTDSLRTRTNTRDLDHGHVITLWWVIFNNPDECAGEGCGEADLFNPAVEPSCVYAEGSIVGGNGHARFIDRLTVGEHRDSCIDFFVDLVPGLEGEDHGLTNPQGAEVHLVLRSHGPRIPGQVAEQRTTFAGGCEFFLDPGATHELEPGQCSDLQFAVFPAGS